MLVKLDHVTNEAENIRMFWFKPERPVDYIAGQFIELTLPHPNPDERGQKHWFTLTSSPSEPLLAITTKFDPARVSTFKQTLRNLKPGDSVQMSDPMGDFVLPKDMSRPLVFIAGGIGITPMRSMIKWLHDRQEHRTIHILYAAHTIEEVVFRSLFNDYGAPMDIILNQPPSGWEGQSGRLDATKILELAPNVDNKLYYLSGPEPMTEALFKDLQTAGVNQRQLVTDYFPGYKAI